MTNQGQPDESSWVVAPPGANEVRVTVAVGGDAELTPELRAALEARDGAAYVFNGVSGALLRVPDNEAAAVRRLVAGEEPSGCHRNHGAARPRSHADPRQP